MTWITHATNVMERALLGTLIHFTAGHHLSGAFSCAYKISEGLGRLYR